MIVGKITFPRFTGLRCLMMPYIQGEPSSVPNDYHAYFEIVKSVFFKRGDVGYLTIDESVALEGKPHRGARARSSRALHTEVGRRPNMIYAWGSPYTWGGPVPERTAESPSASPSIKVYTWGDGGGWGEKHLVTLDRDVEVLLANNVDDSCALWNATHYNTSLDGDIGYEAERYPYADAVIMKAGEVHKIGILTPHESLPVKETIKRQFLRIISSGVHGRELYFTVNPLLA